MRDLSRLIDANSNRAAEAARTLEDLARFSLDDGPLAARSKRARHRLESILATAGFDRAARARDRDTPRDPGTVTSAADPHTRADVTAIAAAAGSRLTEALRTLEEAMKTIDSAAAAGLEALRYDAYETERLVLRRLGLPRVDWRLCLLLTESLCSPNDWRTVLAQSIEGGVDCVQVREKSLSDRELLVRVREVIELARPRGVAVVVNDRPDLAAIAGADGVHLGQTDLHPSDARRVVGETCVLGVSCSTPEQAVDAALAGADVLGIGAMYSSATKPKPTTAGPALLSAVLSDPLTASVPHLAIGGIDADRARALAVLGCRGVAVSGALCAAADPRASAAGILASLSTSDTPAGAAT